MDDRWSTDSQIGVSIPTVVEAGLGRTVQPDPVESKGAIEDTYTWHLDHTSSARSETSAERPDHPASYN